MKYILFILFIFCFGYTSVAQRDSAAIEVRTIDQAAINKLKNDSDFQYSAIKEPTLSWWDRFWLWFWWKVKQLMETKSGRTTVWTIIIALCVLVLGYSFFRLSKMNKGGLFARSSGNGLNFTVGHEDIHQISFEEAINEAIGNKNYRLAVRLMYLQTLKVLTDRNMIEWKVNKTNSDYVREVSAKPWQSLFGKLTYQFEYAWYGETSVTQEKFEMLRQDFKQLHNLV